MAQFRRWRGEERGQSPAKMLVLRDSPRTRQNDNIMLLVRSYVPDGEIGHLTETCEDRCPRICASWVEAVPVLYSQIDTSRVTVLPVAVEALAVTIAGHGRQLDGRTDVTRCTQSYCRALRLLRKALESPIKAGYAELAAAIMCLSICEVSLFERSIDSLRQFSHILLLLPFYLTVL